MYKFETATWNSLSKMKEKALWKGEQPKDLYICIMLGHKLIIGKGKIQITNWHKDTIIPYCLTKDQNKAMNKFSSQRFSNNYVSQFDEKLKPSVPTIISS